MLCKHEERSILVKEMQRLCDQQMHKAKPETTFMHPQTQTLENTSWHTSMHAVTTSTTCGCGQTYLFIVIDDVAKLCRAFILFQKRFIGVQTVGRTLDVHSLGVMTNRLGGMPHKVTTRCVKKAV